MERKSLPLRYYYGILWVHKFQRCPFKYTAIDKLLYLKSYKWCGDSSISTSHAWNQLQKHSTCWWNATFSCVLYLFRWGPHVCIWIWIPHVLPHTLSDQSDHLYAYECTAVTEHVHHHLHKKTLLPPAWCHWLRVTGGCLCHPSEPLTASSPACHSCCLSGQWGRQQVHSLRDSIIHQGAHLKLGPACLHSLRPSHARLTHTEV